MRVLVQANGAQLDPSPAEQGHQHEGEILGVLVQEMLLIIVLKYTIANLFGVLSDQENDGVEKTYALE